MTTPLPFFMVCCLNTGKIYLIYFLWYTRFVDTGMCVRDVGNVFQRSGADLILLLVDASSQQFCFPAVLLSDRHKVC